MVTIPLYIIYCAAAIILTAALLIWAYNTRTVIALRIKFHGRDSALKRAIKKANKRHLKTGKRYRVFFLGMRYRVYDRGTIKDYKKAGVFNRYINSTTIDHTKFYDTNDFKPCL